MADPKTNATEKSKMIVVGVSGPSSSGKTTLSRALRDLFESAGVPTVLVHEDDFYLDEQR